MKAVFIDRDGVINKDPGGWTEHSYVTKWEQFKFLPGALDALKSLNKNGIKVILISNQAGVGKGHFSRNELDAVTGKMIKEVRRAGGEIEAVYYCTHKKEDNCDCRKPNPGLIEKAVEKFDIDPAATYFIGDSEVDVIAGRRAGCKTIFVLSGKTSREDMGKWHEKPDYVFANLLEAAGWVLKKEKRRSERASRRDK